MIEYSVCFSEFDVVVTRLSDAIREFADVEIKVVVSDDDADVEKTLRR